MDTWFFRLAVVTLTLSVPALAHGEHCHRSTPEGTLLDEPSATSIKACKEKGGFWMTHAATCRRDGVVVGQADSEQQCAKLGGRWDVQGHDRRGAQPRDR